jgi:hypothetical protein
MQFTPVIIHCMWLIAFQVQFTQVIIQCMWLVAFQICAIVTSCDVWLISFFSYV